MMETKLDVLKDQIENSKNFQPFLIMATDQIILSWMLWLLHPPVPISVYYVSGTQTYFKEPCPIPQVDPIQLSYVEIVERMPTKTQLRKGYKINFRTQNTESTVQLVHSVGEGGFGRVYKATV